MRPEAAPLVLEIVDGVDRGQRLELGTGSRTLGRARDADMVLRDAAVSRRHLRVVSTAGAVSFEVYAGAAPALVGGRPLRKGALAIGDRLVIGSTVLELRPLPSSSDVMRAAPQVNSELGTAMTGIGADARGLASLHALIEALDVTLTREALFAALGAWARDQTPPSTVRMVSASEPGSRAPHEARDATVITIPVPSSESVALAFEFAARRESLPENVHRILVVAARIFGSSMLRVDRLEVARGEVASLRVLSFGSSTEFLGTSPAAKKLAERIPKIAVSDVHALIEGETGVGKTFAARLIHERGPRSAEPLKVINCAAIPEALLESELFGHERGAFTSASARRIGVLEAAGRGTLFLDEVAELSPQSQTKLLRALEERRFERVGSNTSIELKAHVLLATNRNLEAMVAQGQFRQDLLFRISVVRVTIPPLRERGDDLMLLAHHILGDLVRAAHRRIDGFSEEAIAAIRRYSWPGNVRELKNAIEHAIVLGDGPTIRASDFPEAVVGLPPGDEGDTVTLPIPLAELEARDIAAALRLARDNKKRAAAILGISRSTFYDKLESFTRAPGKK